VQLYQPNIPRMKRVVKFGRNLSRSLDGIYISRNPTNAQAMPRSSFALVYAA